MRWLPVACALCMDKDIEERLEDYPDCTPELYQELCLSDPHDAQACLEKCGG
jgi:hypothetical protein